MCRGMKYSEKISVRASEEKTWERRTNVDAIGAAGLGQTLASGETEAPAEEAGSRSGAKNAATRERPSVLNGTKYGRRCSQTGLAIAVTETGSGATPRMESKYSALVSVPPGINGR